MAKTPWWCKLEFLEFSRHYIGMTDKQIVDDVRRSIESLCKENTKGNDFGSFLVRKALNRIESKAATASRENGKNGGRPPVRIPLPKDKQEVLNFAADHGLDTFDASEWYEINIKGRGGYDKNGKPIYNWPGALTNHCKEMEANRKKRESA